MLTNVTLSHRGCFLVYQEQKNWWSLVSSCFLNLFSIHLCSILYFRWPFCSLHNPQSLTIWPTRDTGKTGNRRKEKPDIYSSPFPILVAVWKWWHSFVARTFPRWLLFHALVFTGLSYCVLFFPAVSGPLLLPWSLAGSHGHARASVSCAFIWNLFTSAMYKVPSVSSGPRMTQS